MNEEIRTLLAENGLIPNSGDKQSRLALALSQGLSERPGDGQALLDLANGLEEALVRHAQCSILLAKLCGHLQRMTGWKATKISVVLAGATPELVRDLSWVTKLIKAGDVLLNWPQLEDVGNIDKLATLKRVPKKLQKEVFESGKLPDGREFRGLDRRELADAVNSLRAGQTSVPPNPYSEARKQLLKLATEFGPICQQLAELPGYRSISERVHEMQRELVKIIDEASVVPRVSNSSLQRQVA